MVSLFVVIYISVFIFLMVKEASMRVIFISFILLSALILEYGDVNLPFKIMLLLGFLVMSIGVIRPLRERLLTRKIFVMLRRVIPVMSNTEK
jgi:membrane protein implicated in regulation of membrane protease activity